MTSGLRRSDTEPMAERISESLAKMTLSREADVHHVEEAIRLFKVSTISAANSGVAGVAAAGSVEMRKSVQRMEAALKSRMAVGRSASVKKLREDFSKQGYSRQVIDLAIDIVKFKAESICKQAADGAFSRAHRPDQIN